MESPRITNGLNIAAFCVPFLCAESVGISVAVFVALVRLLLKECRRLLNAAPHSTLLEGKSEGNRTWHQILF